MELENGTYKARAAQWDLGLTGTGKEQVAVMFELLDPAFAGQRITWFGYFTEKALPITVKALRTMGWQGDDLLNLQGLDGNEVELVIANETYEGKTRPKVQFVNAVGGGLSLATPMAPDQQRSFAAQMRMRIAAINAGEGAQKSAPKQRPSPASDRRPEPPPITDDIPF